MAKILTLFGEEETLEIPATFSVNDLPLIPVAKKNTGKTDTPFEREIRRFNRLIKELHEYESQLKQQEKLQEDYDRLYQTRLVPVLVRLGKAKHKLAEHLHKIFCAAKFSKSEKRIFVEIMLKLLNSIIYLVPESNELVRTYLDLNMQLLSKKNQTLLKVLMEENDLADVSMDDCDIKEIWEQDNDFFEGKTWEEAEDETTAKSKKKTAFLTPEKTDIHILFRELAKILHPDLEQDEHIRTEKEQLMKQVIHAKKQNDLHAMLVLKSKAGLLTGNENHYTGDAEQLKRYNKQLNQKLNQLKGEHTMRLFNSISTDSNGFIYMGGGASPAERIEQEINDIEQELKEVQSDIRKIRCCDDVKEMIEMYKSFK